MGAEEFGRLGPFELFQLMEEWSARQRREDLRAGMVCQTIANCNRDPKTRPFPWSAADFFPSLWSLFPEPSEEDLLRKACAMFGVKMPDLPKE